MAFFQRLTSWRDADADTFVAGTVPMVRGAQQAMVTMTDAYIAAMLADLLGEDIQPLGLQAEDNLRGVDAEAVYRRPFTQIWTDLSQGSLLRDAIQAGERRSEGLAATDLELAKTHASRQALEGHDDERIVGYRRVLTGAENCAMCVLASTQRYHIGDLLPIHPACDCAVAPIIGDADPGQIINSVVVTEGAQALTTNSQGVNVFSGDQLTDLGELLEPLHEEIEKRFGKSDRGGRALDYRKVLTVHQHGEIGPVLAVKGQHFTGPAEIPTH
ncbi:hypothetical protein E1286_05155 [Nonomuraea terrae]|uniref:Phage head morphogenesis domain-containing protein n=1 Tax=Nonomuraea terrae TaxID=2530383 RepID=A0A4R4ZA19_9ACTN|nr:hypothetical protein [Nonomuraea terrae]TDD54580.1 hypothetical protein E1286_05155 [Nonomuraea terrae]